MSEKYIYTPEIEAPDLRSKREKVGDLKKALQESRRIVVNQNFSLSTALAILPEWVRDIIETGITVYDFIDSRLIVDGQWIKIRFINFRWNWKILTGLISSIIRIYKTWTTNQVAVFEDGGTVTVTHRIEEQQLKKKWGTIDDPEVYIEPTLKLLSHSESVKFNTHKIVNPGEEG